MSKGSRGEASLGYHTPTTEGLLSFININTTGAAGSNGALLIFDNKSGYVQPAPLGNVSPERLEKKKKTHTKKYSPPLTNAGISGLSDLPTFLKMFEGHHYRGMANLKGYLAFNSYKQG